MSLIFKNGWTSCRSSPVPRHLIGGPSTHLQLARRVQLSTSPCRRAKSSKNKNLKLIPPKKPQPAQPKRPNPAQKKVITAPHEAPSPIAKPQSSFIANGNYNPFADKLASKASPTLIYQSPSKGLYIFSCTALGTGCIAWAAWQVWSNFISSDFEIDSSSVKLALGSVSVFMVAFGGYMFTRTARIVRSITAIPKALSSGRPSLLLKIESGAFFPRTYTAAPIDVVSNGHLFVTHSMRAATETKSREGSREKILTLPFRQAGYWIGKGFRGFQSLFFDDKKWIYISVNGRYVGWRLDRDFAWALDSGKGFDLLIRKGHLY